MMREREHIEAIMEFNQETMQESKLIYRSRT